MSLPPLNECPEMLLSEIKVPEDRFRKEEDQTELAELIESLRAIGQIQPVILDANDNSLVAGSRRIAAARILGWETIRYVYRHDLDSLTRRIIEFDENKRRKNFTWSEEAAALAEIHRLKVAQAATQNEDWSVRDTARELGLSVGKVSEDLFLADAVSNERVASRPSRRGAITTARRERELALVRELARRRTASVGLRDDADVTSTPTKVQTSSGVFYNADCREVVSKLEPSSVDLVVMDPPWLIDFDGKASQWTTKWVPSYDDSSQDTLKAITEVVPLLFRAMKPATHVYCFFPIQAMDWWVALFQNAGFVVRQRPLVWFKTGQQSITDTYTNFLPAYECVLWGYKPGENGVRRFFSRPVAEGYGFPRQAGQWHENEKPTELLENWIEASSDINEIVLDPFAGGGSTLIGAAHLGRYYIGAEKDQVNFSKTKERLLQFELKKEMEIPADEEEVEEDQ